MVAPYKGSHGSFMIWDMGTVLTISLTSARTAWPVPQGEAKRSAKCDFYRPKAGTEEQLKEAHSNLLRMVQAIPLTEEEQLAVKEGLDAISSLCAGLADTPTPAGPTPRQLHWAQEQGIVLLDEISVANEKSE